MLLTLDQFIQKALQRVPSSNNYVKEPGFKKLYVRYGKRYLQEELHSNILDIANVEASKKGKGTFTLLIERLRREYPGMGIYVECVLTDRFSDKLCQLGFTRVTGQENSYFWLPENPSPENVL